MASIEEVRELRRSIAEPDDTTYDDAALSLLIDTAGSLDGAALIVWKEKAASFVGLVDISEGGSSRKNSDLHKQALAMIAAIQDRVDAAAENSRTKIRKLVRS